MKSLLRSFKLPLKTAELPEGHEGCQTLEVKLNLCSGDTQQNMGSIQGHTYNQVTLFHANLGRAQIKPNEVVFVMASYFSEIN